MKKKFLIVAIALVVVMGLFWAVFLGMILFYHNEKSTDDIHYYRAISGETEGEKSLRLLGEAYDVPCDIDLPKMDELMPYTSYRFDHTVVAYSMFSSYSYSLIVNYEAQDYAEKKAWLTNTYSTWEESVPGDETPLEAEFELDGFSFRLIDDGYCPKSMMFVGTCDARQEIAIIYFYDIDLDYISPSMQEFLSQDTGWKNVMD